MKVIVTKNYEDMSRIGAEEIVKVVNEKPNCILGLATGSTPEGMYRNLIKFNKDGKVDFSKVTSFNLDEYRGLPGTHDQSYRYYMNTKLFNHINIKPENTHVPNGVAENIEEECKNYDAEIAKMGGIDFQVLGIGNNGHIGFNEPSDFLYTGTHLTHLTEDTIEANSRFFSNIEEVPKEAITMGLNGIMKAKTILLLANGKQKAEIISKLVDGKVDTMVPASILQVHPNVIVIVDEEAASLIKTNKLNVVQTSYTII